MKRRIFAFLFVLILTFALVPTHAKEDSRSENLTPAYIVASAETGQVLFEKDSASTTDGKLLYRMMICLMAVENPDDSLTAFMSGQNYIMSDLVKIAMLSDSQTATQLLAELLFDSSEELLTAMNGRVSEMGLTNTLFTPSASHTTVQDMASFLVTALKNPEFKSIYGTQATVLKTDQSLISNQNRLVLTSGESRNVGGTYTTYSLSGKQEICAISYLGRIFSLKENSIMDILLVADRVSENVYEPLGKQLLTTVREDYFKTTVIKAGDVLLSIPVGSDTLDLVAKTNVYSMHSVNLEVPSPQISFVLQEPYDITNMKPPIIAGTPLGTANVQLSDGTIVSVGITAGNSVYFHSENINDFYAQLIANKQILGLIGILLITEIFLIIGKIRLRLWNRGRS